MGGLYWDPEDNACFKDNNANINNNNTDNKKNNNHNNNCSDHNNNDSNDNNTCEYYVIILIVIIIGFWFISEVLSGGPGCLLAGNVASY